jgi:16S rRNA (guanine527-N7)-methyltransferase
LRLIEALAAEPDPPTTVRDPLEAADVHIADSLSGLEVARLVAAKTICDVGAGAGFPGLPLAVALPDARIDLVEATARKAEVIERLATAAGIANARAVAERAETWAHGEGSAAYDAVTARAVDALPVLLEYAAPLLRSGGALVAWKGSRSPDEEAAAVRAAAALAMEAVEIRAVRPFRGVRARHLHVYVKTGPTPAGIPRRPGMARKRPLG